MCEVSKMDNVVLIGMPGSGKSTSGRLLSQLSGKEIIDTDDEIVRTTGMSIPEIFEKYGETHFRTLESDALLEFRDKKGVVATGGGALLSDVNSETAKNAGVVAFIDVPFDVCYERIKDDENRPVAFNSTKEQLQKRFDYRRPLYLKNSHFSVDGNGTPNTIALRIIEKTEEN